MSMQYSIEKIVLSPGQLGIAGLRSIWQHAMPLELDPACFKPIDESVQTIKAALKNQQRIYGVNTGFGKLADTIIPSHQLEELQEKIVLSHAAGVGSPLSDAVVRLCLALKINSLARGFSGIRLEVIQALLALYNAKVYPIIPEKGSVGASGDLAPLAHLSAVLLGVGEVRHKGKILTAKEGLKIAGLKPIKLIAKEGLALLNGTQVSTALALNGLFLFDNVFTAAILAGSMSVDAAAASDVPFDSKIHHVRGQEGQIDVAKMYRYLFHESPIRESHRNCTRTQDPYSLRCQPQVMGSCLDYRQVVSKKLALEANAVTDNPLVFSSENEILSGGNFHAEPVAMAADVLAICFAEVGNISERRIALLIDAHLSGLPAFLVPNPGINSGFMLAQVTAAALASENKSLAHPASVDTIPTSANQEDHVSMATYAARRLTAMAENCAGIVAIELLAACQGIDLRRPLETSKPLKKIYRLVRKEVAFYSEDRFFAPDIATIKHLVEQGVFFDFATSTFLPVR